MTYTVIKTLEEKTTDDEVALVQIVETSNEHTAIDFEKGRYTQVNRFRFESGYIRLDDSTKVEITRVLMSCEKDHAHGVYYQAPRQMTLWEAMFAIGEVNPVEGDLFADDKKDGE